MLILGNARSAAWVHRIVRRDLACIAYNSRFSNGIFINIAVFRQGFCILVGQVDLLVGFGQIGFPSIASGISNQNADHSRRDRNRFDFVPISVVVVVVEVPQSIERTKGTVSEICSER